MNDCDSALPASWYSDPEIFQKERLAIFSKEWLFAADLSRFQKPGDSLALEIAGFPLFLILGQDEKIRAFHNYCLHRGAPLIAAENVAINHPALTCRYHGWTYSTEGKLLAAPYFDLKDLQACEKANLTEIKVGIFKSLIFINLDPKTTPFLDSFAPVLNEIHTAQVDVDSYSSQAVLMQRQGNFNWKVWMDGFQECYHCPTIHPVFNRDFILKNYKVVNHEKYSVHACDRKLASEAGSFNGLWLWVYPNLGLPFYEPCFYTLFVNPINHFQTQLNYIFHFKPNEAEESRARFLNLIRQITEEDVQICERVQKNIEAGVFQKSILHSERETGVIYFHSLVKKALTLL